MVLYHVTGTPRYTKQMGAKFKTTDMREKKVGNLLSL
jgi:hypothetical protein